MQEKERKAGQHSDHITWRFSLNLPTFPWISQAIPKLNGKKGQTFTFDFSQSHIAISANFARIDINSVPIDQGKSILFEY